MCFQNANLRSSRDAQHSSSLSDMATTPMSPTLDDVFWDFPNSEEHPPKVGSLVVRGFQGWIHLSVNLVRQLLLSEIPSYIYILKFHHQLILYLCTSAKPFIGGRWP